MNTKPRTRTRTCAFRGFRGAAAAFRFLPPVVAPCNLKNTQTLAKGRSRIDNTRRMVQRRRQHTGLEPSVAGPDASGPAAVEDARGAVAVARREEPPRFPMDGFVGGGLRLALVSRAEGACGGWRREKGRVPSIFSHFSRHFRAVGLPVRLCLACARHKSAERACLG